MYGPTTQCINKTYQMFQLFAGHCSLTYSFSLNLHRSKFLINDRLLDASPNVIHVLLRRYEPNFDV